MTYVLISFSLEHCTDPPECQNGGILNFKCKCMCPEGLAGETCETVETQASK